MQNRRKYRPAESYRPGYKDVKKSFIAKVLAFAAAILFTAIWYITK